MLLVNRYMKNQIRKSNKIKRAEMTSFEVKSKSRDAAEKFLSSGLYKSADTIMLYMPLGNETKTEDIIKAAFSDGKKVVFPVTDKSTGEITPYYADKDTEFKCGAFAIYEPHGTEIADAGNVDVFVVPGIAFDKNGARVGFGMGCYDRFLQGCDGIKVGLCYDFQICRQIVADEHDIKMDYIVTESRIINCKE